jgi:serine/threonine-protein kinase
VKIVDFGISKVRAKSGQITRTSTVIGTPQYMSPEQALGQSDRIDARSDQFSLACIIYEMIVGRCPFDGDSVPALMYQLVHVDPPPMQVNGRPVSPAIEAVVRRGLAKQVSIDVQDPPPGLLVSVDNGEPRPVPARLRRGSGTHTLVFQAPGYRPRPLRLDAAKDLSLVLSLKKIPAHAAKEGRGRPTASRPPDAPAAPPVVADPPRKRSSAITDL